MTLDTKALEACPFCGAGETRIDEQTYWTGMSSKVLSVTLRHWCGAQPDEFVKPAFTIRARDEAQAIEAWNRRATPARNDILEEAARVVETFSPIRDAFETEDEGGMKYQHPAVQTPIYNPSKLAAAIRALVKPAAVPFQTPATDAEVRDGVRGLLRE